MAAALLPLCVFAQSPANVLVVVNDTSLVSRRIGEYYVRKRGIPLANVCHLKVAAGEQIERLTYEQLIEAPIAAHLKSHRLEERILYMVTSLGVPLHVKGSGTDADTTAASVDSELTLLYARMRGVKFQLSGMIPNPLFGKRGTVFQHPESPIYLVTRLAGYDFEDVKGIIDRSLAAVNRGKFVIDLRSSEDDDGNRWLRAAASLLPKDRLVLDESSKVLYDQRDVIGFASWGSNDRNRKRRLVGFQWLPGAIVNEYVSTNGRTFQRPPDAWNITTWKDTAHFFAESPQTLSADYIHEGATGCSGHTNEPFLVGCPRPDYVLPAYFQGRTLAESYYLGIRGLSWQNIVIGDPLCKLAHPR
ncbi:MAG: TIGR03790 family protein [Acidobacteria bacterium]|nr:TIGR03790 family protein [Acidobacteriota bacterium]MBI3471838.1 TIGR03790 family protein [Candidatus Solibacter usitatus]